jgi:hypothetical protein
MVSADSFAAAWLGTGSATGSGPARGPGEGAGRSLHGAAIGATALIGLTGAGAFASGSRERPSRGWPGGRVAATGPGRGPASLGLAAVRERWPGVLSAPLPPVDVEASLGVARPDQCGLSGSLMAVRTTAALPIPELIVSCKAGTGVTATGSGARASCFERADFDWAQPAAARLRRITANTRFMIGLVSVLGDWQPRQARLKRNLSRGRGPFWPSKPCEEIDPPLGARPSKK